MYVSITCFTISSARWSWLDCPQYQHQPVEFARSHTKWLMSTHSFVPSYTWYRWKHEPTCWCRGHRTNSYSISILLSFLWAQPCSRFLNDGVGERTKVCCLIVSDSSTVPCKPSKKSAGGRLPLAVCNPWNMEEPFRASSAWWRPCNKISQQLLNCRRNSIPTVNEGRRQWEGALLYLTLTKSLKTR